MSRLNAVFEWKMTPQEVEAFKLALTWEELTDKNFPGVHLAKLPAKKDPRKSALFRSCWKLVRMTRGLLKSDQIRLYITAQLHVIRAHGGRIDPGALSGDKAWVRWLVWKRLYDKKLSEISGEAPPPSIKVSPAIIRDLGGSKRLLFEHCDGEPSRECMQRLFDEGRMRIWITGKKFSPLYFLLSPWIKQLGGVEKFSTLYGFDPGLYEKFVNDDVKSYFQAEFSHEF